MSFKKNKLSVLVAALSGLTGGMALVSPQVFAQEDTITEEVLVKGFRKSVAAAVNIKRNSANNVDSIIAEDIGKMPDLNLAESIQRVPGVAITREGGEGRQITVRGLGPQYTRVTLNGMEVPASTGGLDSADGVNRGRSFDFNVFSADLFRQININKNSVAHIEEGGLASTVELHTLRPLDNPGLNANAALQTSYNIHTGELDPRLTGMISNTFNDDKFGVILGFKRSQRTVHQEGYGSVRWTGAEDNRRGLTPVGWGWGDNTAEINGTPNPAANYGADAVQARYDNTASWNASTPAERLAPGNAWNLDATDAEHVALANDPTVATVSDLDFIWAPRLPRTDSFNQDQTRTSFLLGLQGRPTDELELSLDVMKSELESDVLSYNYFTQVRNLHNTITPVSVTLDPTGRYMTAATFDGVQPRSESRGQFNNADFSQVVARASYDLNDSMTIDAMIGNASSEFTGESYRYNMTTIDTHRFTYDFQSNGDISTLEYDPADLDVLDPSQYEFTGPDHRLDIVNRDNTTFKLDFTWELGDEGSNVKTGLIANEREIDSYHSRRAVGLTTPNAPSANNTNSLSSAVDNYGDGIGGPSGFLTDWLIADINVVRQEYNAGVWEDDPARDSDNYIVSEDTQGLYAEGTYVLNNLTLNGGVRYVETTVKGNKRDIEQSYDNFLPAINIVYEPVEDVLVRGAFSQNIARPNPQNLAGAVEFTPINGNITIQNPGLKPELADNLDFAVEWYFAEDSYVGITLFNKTITDTITSVTVENTGLSQELQDIVAQDVAYEPLPSPNHEPNAILPTDPNGWNLTQSANSDEEDKINGVELAASYIMDNGFGVLANYTNLDTDSDYEGLSENSYNLGVFYENDTFAARVLVNHRDDYITDFTGSNGNAEHANTGPTRVDFSGSYNFSEMLDFTVEIINLTNEKERLFTTGPTGDLNLVREYHTTGTELLFGVRATF